MKQNNLYFTKFNKTGHGRGVREIGKTDWIKIKNEYINSNISYRKLAKKHGICFSTLEKTARKEKWTSQRKKQRDKIATKLSQKTADIIVDAEVSRIDRILSAADEALNAITSGLGELNKYIDRTGKVRECDIIDAVRLQKFVSALKDAAEVATKYYDPDSHPEREENILYLASLINNPQPDRRIIDYEEGEDEQTRTVYEESDGLPTENS